MDAYSLSAFKLLKWNEKSRKEEKNSHWKYNQQTYGVSVCVWSNRKMLIEKSLKTRKKPRTHMHREREKEWDRAILKGVTWAIRRDIKI